MRTNAKRDKPTCSKPAHGNAPIQNEQADNVAAWALYEKAVALGHWDIKPTCESTSECT
ncbi:hypothetical protein EMIT0324P_30124 [Pseudomonas chlororaphis]